jgi:hypothetical protein
MINETENKIIMGAVGLIEEIMPTMSLFKSNAVVERLFVKVIIDSCHSKLNGLLGKYTRPKPGTSSKPPINPTPYPDYFQVDNRAKLGEVGICGVLVEILSSFAKFSGEPEDPENLLIATSKAIATLGSNDNNSILFGQEGCCEVIAKLLSNTKCRMEQHEWLLWALIMICSDSLNGNSIRFGQAGIMNTVVDHFREIKTFPTNLSKQTHFSKYVEYLCWSVNNLIRYCPENIILIRDIPSAQKIMESVLSIDDVIPRGAKIKLNQAYIDIFEKFSLVEIVSNKND